MSRHRKIKLSRSKAIAIAAAGALSVATAASATAATWSPATQGHSADPAEISRTGTHQAAAGAQSAGPDWQTDAATQIRWGLDYIRGTYGSPCGAWAHEQATGWY